MKTYSIPASTYSVILACLALISMPRVLPAEPQPGDVFREYHLVHGGSNGQVENAKYMDPFVFISHHNPEDSTPGDRTFTNIDLEHAIKAEFVASHWGGHIGSSNRRVVFNDNPAVPLPLIQNTPTQPECYFSQQCMPACEIPFEYLKPGDNDFRLLVDNQICYSFNWGWFWTNQAVLRIYYDADKVDNPVAEMVSPATGSTIHGFAQVECKIISGDVKKVDFIGNYTDFSWEGSGEYKTWHGVFWMDDTTLSRHIGAIEGAHLVDGDIYPIYWDTSWIPDQQDIHISARVYDHNGLIYMVPAMEDITLDHQDKATRMYTSPDFPECFTVQTTSASCSIDITGDLDNAILAKLVFSTFSGGKPDREVYINGYPVKRGGWGTWHRVGMCEAYVPVSKLKIGRNTFTIKACSPGEHGFEIHWPGPVLFVLHENPDYTPEKTECEEDKAAEKDQEDSEVESAGAVDA